MADMLYVLVFCWSLLYLSDCINSSKTLLTDLLQFFEKRSLKDLPGVIR